MILISEIVLFCLIACREFEITSVLNLPALKLPAR
jgi:hypothetical protein